MPCPSQMPGNVQQAAFQCNIPRAAVTAPSRVSLYGHGLLGDHTQIEEDNITAMSAEHDFTFCATDWSGMAKEDIPNAISALKDLSNFPSLPDRLQQGILNTLYLGRLLAHPQGFAANPAFQASGRAAAAGHLPPVLGLQLAGRDPRRRHHRGRAGLDPRRPGRGDDGLRHAAAPLDRLRRLPDVIFRPAYPDEGQRILALSIIQMLWDRGETDGWAGHVTTGPPANTPAHTVLMHVAVGDHQVANAMSDVEARTIGAYAYRPAVDPGRSFDVTPLFGIPTIPSFPWSGSAIVYWDGGPQTPPTRDPEHPQPGRRRPALLPAQHGGGAQPEVRLPVAGRRRDRRLRRQACHTDNFH